MSVPQLTDRSEYTQVRSLLEESLALFKASGLRQYIAHPLYCLGKVAARQGDLPAAHACYQESLALFQELDDQRSSATYLEGWASVVARQGEAIWAAQLWGGSGGATRGWRPILSPRPLSYA